MIFKQFIQLRKQGPGLIILGLVVYVGVVSLRSKAVDTTTAMSSSGAPVASIDELEKITPSEARRLKNEFQKSLSSERKKYIEEEKQARKLADATRKEVYKDWNEKEKSARRKFFDENAKGEDRREYVKAMMERRRVLLETQKNEIKDEKRVRSEKRKAFEDNQRNRQREFNRYLQQLKRPPVGI